MKRYENRGNNKKFIELINKNWESWIEDIEESEFNCVKLSEGEFIENVIDIKQYNE